MLGTIPITISMVVVTLLALVYNKPSHGVTGWNEPKASYHTLWKRTTRDTKLWVLPAERRSDISDNSRLLLVLLKGRDTSKYLRLQVGLITEPPTSVPLLYILSFFFLSQCLASVGLAYYRLIYKYLYSRECATLSVYVHIFFLFILEV